MERDDYAQMVDYLEDRFGIGAMDAWAAAAVIYPDFEKLDSECVWKAMLAKLDADPKADFPPKPPALRAAALERIRQKARPPLPETTEHYDWAEFSRRTYGEVIPMSEAVERRHSELAAAGKAQTGHSDSHAGDA